MDIADLVFIGVFLGILGRTFLPYLRKLREAADRGDRLLFDYRYLVSAMVSVILSLFTAILILPGFEVPETNAFYLAFAYGWAANDLVNMVIK